MKSFLACWLAEAPRILKRELAGNCDLRPCTQLPEPGAAVSFSISSSAFSGCFLISAERISLKKLFPDSGPAADDEIHESHLDLWRKVLEQIAESAVLLFDPAATSSEVSVAVADWTLGRPSAAFELHCGESVTLLAFTDEVGEMERATRNANQNPERLPVNGTKIVPGSIDLLLDVELEASIRFGSREMPLNEVLDLGAGDVVELDRHVSDPVDLLVGDKIVARGEVVLVNGSFGLRVLEVAEPKKCLESIRCLF